MTTFQIILTAIFGAFIVGALVVVSMSKGGSSNQLQPIVLWGTVSEAQFSQALQEQARITGGTPLAQYTQITPADFDRRLVEALASGTGPDAVLLPQDLIMRFSDKVLPVSYNSITLRQFKDTFVDEGELLASDAGLLGLPFTIDPLVLYWNRDLYSTAGIPNPPRNWTEAQEMLPKLSKRDATAGTVSQSAFALGEYSNVGNAKEILSALFIQGGSTIIGRDERGQFASMLNSEASGQMATRDALVFYTQFANPAHKNYVWNRSKPSSIQAFIGGDLANYIGFSSELANITKLNPNLNFDVAAFPQAPNARVSSTFGRMTSLAMLRGTRNPENTLAVMMQLAGKDFVSIWSNYSNVAPARRDAIVSKPDDPYLDIVYSSALISRAWLDPNPVLTETVFKNMIERVTSGQMAAGLALTTAQREMTSILYTPR